LSPFDLVPREMNEKPNVEASKRVEDIQRLHEMVKSKIEKANASYQVQASKHKKKVVFHPGDLVWVHLRKERFPSKRKSKLMPRADGPFEVLERISDNAYKINLPGDYGVSATFNVADLSPYFEDGHLDNLRANSSQQGEDDGGPSMSMTTSLQGGPRESNFMGNIREFSLACQDTSQPIHGFRPVRKPDFVHIIS